MRWMEDRSRATATHRQTARRPPARHACLYLPDTARAGDTSNPTRWRGMKMYGTVRTGFPSLLSNSAVHRGIVDCWSLGVGRPRQKVTSRIVVGPSRFEMLLASWLLACAVRSVSAHFAY